MELALASNGTTVMRMMDRLQQRDKDQGEFCQKEMCMKKRSATNRYLPAALVLSALAILGTAPAVAQAASSTNESGKSAYARASASTEMPDWFGVAQQPHWQAPDLETKIRRSISSIPERDEFGAEFGYYPGG
jgi:hypothetical protein